MFQVSSVYSREGVKRRKEGLHVPYPAFFEAKFVQEENKGYYKT